VGKKKLKPDPSIKDFWRNEKRYLSLLNGLLFDGKPVIKISDVEERDTDETTNISINEREEKSHERRKDQFREVNIQGQKVLVGIENQNYIDKTMVMRDMEYCALKYLTEFKKSGEIKPVIDLIMYYGQAEWKYEKRLDRMFKVPEAVGKYFNNWESRVIDVKTLDSRIFDDEEVSSFIIALQRIYGLKKDIKVLEGLKLTYDTAIAIGSVTGINELIELAYEKKGEVNMCEAVENYCRYREEESEKKGKELGLKEGTKQGIEKSKVESIRSLMVNLSISVKEAMKLLDIPDKEQGKYMKLVG